MQFPKLISGRFINRDNRFRATLLVAGQETKAHVRNSGNLRHLFTPSVTLVEQGVALSPDVPTARGSRHLRELSALQRKGERAAVVFIVQRADAHTFAPYEAAADPLFAQTLRTAVNEGVEAYAYSCHVTLEEIQISSRIPVQLTV